MLSLLDDVLRPLATSYLDAREARVRAISSRNDDVYTATVVDLDGLPSPDLVTEALAILETAPPQPAPATISSVAAAAFVRKSLARLGLNEWSVEINDQMSATMSVNGPRSRIRVRAETTFSAETLRRLVVHEVGGHVLRWKRSAEQPEPLARLAVGRTTPMEEGLALLGEQQQGVLDDHVLRTYAARVVAVDTAMSTGILGVARRIAPYVGPSVAAQTAMRVKRGLRDPNRPGGSTKDWSYLGGLRMCERMAKEAPEDIAILRGVKWGADCLPVARILAAEGRLRPTTPLAHDTFDSPGSASR